MNEFFKKIELAFIIYIVLVCLGVYFKISLFLTAGITFIIVYSIIFYLYWCHREKNSKTEDKVYFGSMIEESELEEIETNKISFKDIFYFLLVILIIVVVFVILLFFLTQVLFTTLMRN